MDRVGAGRVRRGEDPVDRDTTAVGGGPIRTASSASATCGVRSSASE
jgi:hypothetical protein